MMKKKEAEEFLEMMRDSFQKFGLSMVEADNVMTQAAQSMCSGRAEMKNIKDSYRMLTVLGNPVLAEGEIGHHIEEGVIKIGDGQTSWESLPALGAVQSEPKLTWDEADTPEQKAAVIRDILEEANGEEGVGSFTIQNYSEHDVALTADMMKEFIDKMNQLPPLHPNYTSAPFHIIETI